MHISSYTSAIAYSFIHSKFYFKRDESEFNYFTVDEDDGKELLFSCREHILEYLVLQKKSLFHQQVYKNIYVCIYIM